MHGKKWRISTLTEIVWIVPRLGARAPEGARPVSPSAAAWLLDAWLPEGPRSRAVLAEMFAALAGFHPGRRDTPASAMRNRVRGALASGELRAYHREMEITLGRTRGKEEAAAGERPAPREERTWVGIALVDDDDPPRPVAFKRYRVELPDGSIREGMLDANGQAKIVGIDPGTCKVSFPDFHAGDWQRV